MYVTSRKRAPTLSTCSFAAERTSKPLTIAPDKIRNTEWEIILSAQTNKASIVGRVSRNNQSYTRWAPIKNTFLLGELDGSKSRDSSSHHKHLGWLNLTCRSGLTCDVGKMKENRLANEWISKNRYNCVLLRFSIDEVDEDERSTNY